MTTTTIQPAAWPIDVYAGRVHRPTGWTIRVHGLPTVTDPDPDPDQAGDSDDQDDDK